MKLIGFKVLVLDSNNQTIADLGSITMPILKWTSNLSARNLPVADTDYSYFVANTPDYECIGNAVPTYVYDWASSLPSGEEKIRSNLLKFGPLSILAPTENYRGNKLRLLNPASGYYAENTIGSQGQHADYYTNLYDNNGTLVGQTTSPGLPFRSSNAIGVLLAHNMSGDVVTSTSFSELTIQPYSTATDTGLDYVRVQIYNSSKDQNFIDWVNALQPEPEPPEPPEPSDDPYSPSAGGPGYSATGGGPNPNGTGATGTGGLYDDSSDAIPIPNLPQNVAIGTGIFTAYNPNASQLASFASSLWSIDISDIDDVLKFLVGGDAFNAIIGLHLLPVQPSTSGTPTIKLGKWDSGVQAPKIVSQYVQVPFGSLMLPEYWGNSIDYSPYTKIQLALPYIGIVDVETDDVLGSTNTLTYNIDVLSGAICATLHCVKFNLASVIYQWSGSCAVSLPISGANYNGVISSVLAVAAGAATVAIGGATIAGASGAAATLAAVKGGAAIAGGLGAMAGSALNTFGSVKGKVQKSGAFGANSGALGIMTPYFILTRPVQSVPSTQQATKGYPSNVSAHLGDLSGYTEVTEVHLHNIPGTKDEVLEIESLLKKGVIF